MANQWLRLWHEMPNDPKWRTIAKASGRPIAEVISTFIHLLVTASQNVTRGHADVTPEDIASALDIETTHVEAILKAMQGRVLDGTWVKGWETRQAKKEETTNPESRAKSAAERQRECRERKRSEASHADVTQCHDESREVTPDKRREEEKREEEKKPAAKADALRAGDLVALGVPDDIAGAYMAVRKRKRAGDLPVSTLASIKSEAALAGYTLAEAFAKCVNRNWIDFEAAWVRNDKAAPKALGSVTLDHNKAAAAEAMRRAEERNQMTGGHDA